MRLLWVLVAFVSGAVNGALSRPACRGNAHHNGCCLASDSGLITSRTWERNGRLSFVVRSLLTSLIFAFLSRAEESAGRYRLVQAVSGASFVSEINALAASGYRVETWDSNRGLVAILGKLPEGDSDRYEYSLLPVGPKSEAGLKTLGREGFHVLPWSMRAPKAFLSERRRGEASIFEYRTESERRIGFGPWRRSGVRVLEKFSREGFRVAGLFSGPKDASEVAVLEKSEKSLGPARFGRVKEKDAAKLQNELNQAAHEGYRFLSGISWDKSYRDAIVWLHSGEKSALEYRLARGADTDSLESELNAAGTAGFRLIAGAVFYLKERSSGSGSSKGYATPLSALLEKDSARVDRYQYSVVSDQDLPSLLGRINILASSGRYPSVLIRDISGPRGYTIILEKAIPEATRETH